MADENDPHHPAWYDKDVIRAVQAFHDGKANAGQQQTVRDWFLNSVCRVDDMSFRAGGVDGQRLSDFAEGKRYVANTYRKMLDPRTVQALEQREAKKSRGKPKEASK